MVLITIVTGAFVNQQTSPGGASHCTITGPHMAIRNMIIIQWMGSSRVGWGNFASTSLFSHCFFIVARGKSAVFCTSIGSYSSQITTSNNDNTYPTVNLHRYRKRTQVVHHAWDGKLCVSRSIIRSIYIIIYIYVYIFHNMSAGPNYLLLAMDMAKVGGPLLVSVVKVCTSMLIMCKNRASVGGWSPIGCEGFHTNLNMASPLPTTLVFR